MSAPDQTVTVNLRSAQSALLDLATLLESTGDAAFTIRSLRGLAARYGEMHASQTAGTPAEGLPLAERAAVWIEDRAEEYREQGRRLAQMRGLEEPMVDTIDPVKLLEACAAGLRRELR